jgi:tRNA pseudouridine13 synthase
MSAQAAPTPGYPVEDLPRVLGAPAARGILRAEPEDFEVSEVLPFAPEGEGEHVFLRIEKRGTNTEWVARQLARAARVPPRDVGYAGLKDRNAVTRQWFSVGLAGRPEPDWSALETPELRVVETRRHRRKLRRGALSGNRFSLRVRELDGDPAELGGRLSRLAAGGMANYFGGQRFGNHGSNLAAADAVLAGTRSPGRHRRGLVLSAVRSFLFNAVLARRVADGTWDRPLAGDLLQPDGSHAVFLAGEIDETLEARARSLEIHPTGPLWGVPRIRPGGRELELEAEAAAAFPDWAGGLERLGIDGDRRSMRARVGDLQWSFGERTLELVFTLPAGSYATCLMRELVTAIDGRR